jgi:hypothetical protein
MTTLVGIAAKDGKPGVVLASDMTRTYTGWKSEGDFAVREQTKLEKQKIYVDDRRKLAVAMAGICDPQYYDFLGKLLDGKIDFRKAIRKQYFRELFRLNYDRFSGRIWNQDNQNGLLVATRYENNPKLWTCWPLGRVEKRFPATSIGSGSEHVFQYFKSEDLLKPHGLSLQEAITFAAEAMERASTDIHTGGLDIVVVTPEGIEEHGKTMAQTLKDARREVISNVINRYRTKS